MRRQRGPLAPTSATASISAEQASAEQASAEQASEKKKAATAFERSAPMPTAEERSKIRAVLDPQVQQAKQAGIKIPEAQRPEQFVGRVKELMADYIRQVRESTAPLLESKVKLTKKDIGSLSKIAQARLKLAYGAAVSAPEEAFTNIEKHARWVEDIDATEKQNMIRSWVHSRILTRADALLSEHNVAPARDKALLSNVVDQIITAHEEQLNEIASAHPGFTDGRNFFVQQRLAVKQNEEFAEEAELRRRGRWRALRTVTHEGLHLATHPKYRDAAEGLEQYDVAIEGVTEYLTRPVFERLVEEAKKDDRLRSQIGGSQADKFEEIPVEPKYEAQRQKVEEIVAIMGGDDTGLQLAYFQGKLEYLGLGGWNSADASRKFLERKRANLVGLGYVVVSDLEHGPELKLGRIVLGRGQGLQLGVNAQFGYLAPGQLVTLGGGATLTYRSGRLSYSAGVGLQGRLGRPGRQSMELAVPSLGVGIDLTTLGKLGVLRLDGGVTLLVPIVGGEADATNVRAATRLGVSVVW
jgi:hypothetical protein